MRVAFDCKGTLLSGPQQEKVVKLFKWFQYKKGCEMTIWSNVYSYAEAAVSLNGLLAHLQTKTTRWDLDSLVNPEEGMFDIAVDDDSDQDYLAAKNFIWVHEIPDDESEFEAKFGSLLSD